MESLTFFFFSMLSSSSNFVDIFHFNHFPAHSSTVLRGFHAYKDAASCGVFDSGTISSWMSLYFL